MGTPAGFSSGYLAHYQVQPLLLRWARPATRAESTAAGDATGGWKAANSIMDRETTLRTLAAVGLSLAVMFLWAYFFSPKPPVKPPVTPAEIGQESPGKQTQPPLPDNTTSETADSQAALPVAAEPATESAAEPEIQGERIEGEAGQPNIKIQTATREILLSPRGARILSWKLLDFEQVPGSKERRAVDLVSPQSKALHHDPLYLELPDPALEETVNQAWYLVDRQPPSDEERERLSLPERVQRISFRWASGSGMEVSKTIYVGQDGEYLAWIDWDARLDGRPLDGAALTWGPGIGRAVESEAKNRYAYRGLVVAALPGEIQRFKPQKTDVDVSWPEGMGPRWLALDTQHFALAMIQRAPAAAAVKVFDVQALGKESQAQRLGIQTTARQVTLFGGPKSDRLLKKLDKLLAIDMTSLVNWGFFGFLAKPLYVALGWVQSLVGNWGLAIIIITIVIKVLFFPLTQKSMVSMRRTQKKMAKLQPKVRRIKEKYRDKRDMDSRKKVNEETMALYQKEGVNPMASLTGCMPLVLQLPVLYAMYTVLTVATELRGAPLFGWLHDLSAPDPYFITPLVMGVTMLGQQLLTLTKTEDPQQKSQQRMMLMMPIMFTFFFLRLPSGLVLYWLINNVLGIGQQILINRHADAAPKTT